MTFLIESGRNAPQMEVKLSQMGPGFGDHQASFHSLCHSPTMNHALSGAPPRMKKGRMAADGATLKIGLTFVLRAGPTM